MARSSRMSCTEVYRVSSKSTNVGSPYVRRSLSIKHKEVVKDLEENDDEAERLLRREKNENSCATSSGVKKNGQEPLFDFKLSPNEINNQITQCLKLSIENKINDKNAFQLKLIDFLVYSLKKQDPKMTNLQMASACLDASGKIYGYRVDKVYAELLKIIGIGKGEKRNFQNQNDDNEDNSLENTNENECLPKKKRKKNRVHIISTVESLKGKLEIYDPLSLINSQIDTQTSDKLFQAKLPQHANQGIALNLYNDVVLDKVPLSSHESSKISVSSINDFTNNQICPSYANFNFLNWSLDNKSKSSEDDSDCDYEFNIDDPMPSDILENNSAIDDTNISQEKLDSLAKNIQKYESIDDFQDIIANNPNPNVTYEYSYLQQNHPIRWVGPSHWKVVFKNTKANKAETCKQTVKGKKKDIELSFTSLAKRKVKKLFIQKTTPCKYSLNTVRNWSEGKLINPSNYYDVKRFCRYFYKSVELVKDFDVQNVEEDELIDEGTDNIENFDDNTIEDFTQESSSTFCQNTQIPQSQEALIGDNLVAAPKTIEKIFIPYSQRAKKIDMRQLRKVIWKNLRSLKHNNNNDTEPKEFSTVYSKLPENLSTVNNTSLSPAIAFLSLLHTATEKVLMIESKPGFSDFIIKSDNSER